MTKDLDVDTIIEQLLATNSAPGKQVFHKTLYTRYSIPKNIGTFC